MDSNFHVARKEMFNTGRRRAISTSELGLYCNRADRHCKSRYNPAIKKFIIGVMVIVTVVLVAIFLYDFTYVTSSKVNQETKHFYILQNALKNGSNYTKRHINIGPIAGDDANKTTPAAVVEANNDMQKSVPLERDELSTQANETEPAEESGVESRAQNLSNFKLKKRVLKSVDSNNEEEENAESKQLFDNHAMVYRIKQRYKYPESEEDLSSEETKPTPFHWELKAPYPTAFKRQKFPQLSQYRYPHSSRNIQDIIKYLTNDAEVPSRGIKFTGIYTNPKKYDLYPEIGEMMSNSDRSEEEESSYHSSAFNGDPFYQYKPRHPTDVNLLATSNLRFSPAGVNRYNPYYDPFYVRPVYGKPPAVESQSENGYSSNKKRKPKPFSVMLDIYPITDIMEQNKKNGKQRPQIPLEDYEVRRPIQFNRGPKFYSAPPQPLPLVAMPSQQPLTEEEERQQMIFHLNLYPRRKNKVNRQDIIQTSETMQPEERQQFIEKVMSPLESIAKQLTDHSAIEEAKYESGEQAEKNNSRYLDDISNTRNENISEESLVPSSHQTIVNENYVTTEKYEHEAQKIVATTTESHDDVPTTVESSWKNGENCTETDFSKDIDTVEGFERFNSSFSSGN